MKEVGFLQNFAMSVVFQESHIGRFTLGLFFLVFITFLKPIKLCVQLA